VKRLCPILQDREVMLPSQLLHFQKARKRAGDAMTRSLATAASGQYEVTI